MNEDLLLWLYGQVKVAEGCIDKSSTPDFWKGYRFAIRCVIDKVIEDENK